jgi:ABC-type dipeptide/oligopeptide/nickel transport system permease component
VGISVIVFWLARLSGDVTSTLIPAETASNPEQFARVKHDLGLDRSYPEQYGIWVGHMFQGDFGNSITFHQSTWGLYRDKFPYTLRLAAVAFALSVVIAIPIGVTSALRPGSLWDRAATGFALMGQASPSFFVAILLIVLFSVKLGWLPTSGPGDWKHYIMPALSLSWFSIAALARLTRSAMLEVLDRDHIKLARLNGVPERSIIWRHALKNASIPILTLSSLQFVFFLSGSVVVETIFAWPGIGQLSIQAIRSRDYPMVQTIVLLTSSLVVLTTLVVDLAYAWVDPRIRYGRS